MSALTDILRLIQATEYIPELWQSEYTSLIHKGNSKLNRDNYWGIAISSNV